MRFIRSLVIIGFVTIVLMELALRVYNPVYVPLRANDIYLPINQEFHLKSPNNRKVDPEISFRYNSVGFRGPEPLDDHEEIATIITVGGSTTACILLNDSQTWPDQLFKRLINRFDTGVWLNNAGIDGHSTFGHKILLDSHVKTLGPDYILFLLGINEIGRDDLNKFDKRVQTKYLGIKEKVIAASELLSTVQVFYRSMRAFDIGVNYHYDMTWVDLERIPYSESETAKAIKHHEKTYLGGYRKRIQELIDSTREMGAEPIFMTQPGLMGEGIDPTTGIELSTLNYHKEVPALTKWKILEAYNDVLRETAKQNAVFLIDTAKTMPKDSRYYFDWIHYSIEGAELLGKIVAEALVPYLEARSAE
ncbi:MAG: hypothetical protein KTR18_04745 [Acidiferrobacterales bacterium]|nr:hypothetical protein [Acidiferrobacterales bacterium]